MSREEELEQLKEVLRGTARGYFIGITKKEIWISQEKTGFHPSIEEIDRMIIFLHTLKAEGQDAIDKYNQGQEEDELKWIEDQRQLKKEVKPISNTTLGYIYFLSGEGYVKIGKTTNLDNRMSNLKLCLPFKVELLHTIKSKDINKDEATLHEIFATKRTNGEWFKLSDEDIKEIRAIQEL